MQYKVYLNKKLIDIIFYSGQNTPEEVKRDLVEHDGYDPNIIVKLSGGTK